jgi:hypothetical protein
VVGLTCDLKGYLSIGGSRVLGGWPTVLAGAINYPGPQMRDLRPMYPVGRPHSVQSGNANQRTGCSMLTEQHGVICGLCTR